MLLSQVLKSAFARRAALASVGAFAAGKIYGAQAKNIAHAAEPAFNPKDFQPYKVIAIEKLTHNTNLYRFGLKPDQTAGLPVASCVVTRAPIGEDGKPVIRPYTPTSEADSKGFFELIVKVYEKGVMSKHFGSLKVGDSLDIKGPILKLKYEPNMKRAIGMVAGGTGITPMLQVIEAIVANPNDKTEVSLVYANVTAEDIILKKKIDDIAAKHPNVKVFYVLDKPPLFWRGGSGFITKEMLKQHLPAPAADVAVYVCGPPGMMHVVSGSKARDFTQGEVDGHLKGLDYTTAHVFKF